jgi:anti-sigma factor RsiW
MSDGYGSPDAHAYVDNSLNPADRAAFEAAMRRDAKLRARVDAWEAQNEAVRLAFGAATRPRPPALARPSNENGAKTTARISELKPRPAAEPAARSRPASRWPAALTGALAFAVGMVAAAGGPNDPRAALMAQAATALRASSAFADMRLDFASDDPRVLSAWLSSRFARLPAERFAAPGWSLIGARIVPGFDSAAALALFEDALGGRAALMLEPTDAMPDLPPQVRFDADQTEVAGVDKGVAYVAIGPRHSGVGALVPATPPGDGVQPPP